MRAQLFNNGKAIKTVHLSSSKIREALVEIEQYQNDYDRIVILEAPMGQSIEWKKYMIKYVKGDATRPVGEGNKIIVHINNDLGGWGSGFVVAVSKRWKEPELSYREWHKNADTNDFALGAVKFIKVEDDIYVANMIGQHGFLRAIRGRIVDIQQDAAPPIRYEAVREALKKVCAFAKKNKATVHGPRFGAGLAGGDWTEIEKLINEELISQGIDVTIYDLDMEKNAPFGRKSATTLLN